MQRKVELLSIISFISVSIFILFFFDGTGQEADSISHYLHAKYAPLYPNLYIDHWAKPIFTLIASPFAQFGIIGIKIFNVICSFLAATFLLKTIKLLNIENAALSILFYFIFPLSFLTTFSGLTEPLCAAVLMIAIYLAIKHRFIASSILISFTPFIRSEGLIFMGVFLLYYILKKQWKSIPFLFLGHLIVAVAGSFYHGTLFWVFTKIPYARLESHYGSGSFFHFAEKLNYMMGIPLLILFCLGIVYIVLHLKEYKEQKTQNILFIYSIFLAFFLAHSLFWTLGIFGSLGLKRVFAAVTPIMAFSCLLGFNMIVQYFKKPLKNVMSIVIVGIVLFFPFTKNPAAIEWNDLNLSNSQKLSWEVKNYIAENQLTSHRFIYTDPYFGVVLDIDPFDETKSLHLSKKTFHMLRKGDVIIWDNLHSMLDFDVADSTLSTFTLLKEFQNDNSIFKLYLYD